MRNQIGNKTTHPTTRSTFLKYVHFFCFLVVVFSSCTLLFAQNSAKKNRDYKKWSLEQLLFTIDSGLLDKETRLDYIEFYLQKAKQENATQAIVTGYKKKIANLEGYHIRIAYADSLLALAQNLQNNQLLGIAYGYKSNVEIVVKNYETALNYGLKAEEYLRYTEDLYTLNEVKNSIGMAYFYIEEYKKAYKLFKETTDYHFNNKENTYNNNKKYIIHLFGLSKSAFRLQKYDTLQLLIKEGYSGIKELKVHHQPLEKAYFSLIDGMYHHQLQEYQKSDSLFQSALLPIKENSDFANEHLVYLFLGKNLWEQGKKEQALDHFLKIDTLYQNKDFTNNELNEAYSYIIDYYKEQKNPEKQLHYTNVLLQISGELQTKDKNLTSYLHTNLDTKRLEESKAVLEKEINRNKSWNKIIYVIVAVLVVLLIGLFFIYKKSKKELQNKYELLTKQDNLEVSQSQPELPDAPQGLENKMQKEISDTAQIILTRLSTFEQNKAYLQKITLEELAEQFSTNRSTLSNVINEHKETNFSNYINKLRVDEAVHQIKNNPQLQKQSLDALADEFGFGSAKSFSVTFKKITEISITDFLRLSKQQTAV